MLHSDKPAGDGFVDEWCVRSEKTTADFKKRKKKRIKEAYHINFNLVWCSFFVLVRALDSDSVWTKKRTK